MTFRLKKFCLIDHKLNIHVYYLVKILIYDYKNITKKQK